MVPLERGAFGAAVLDQVVDVGFAATGLEQEVVALLPGREPLGDAAEVGDRLPLGQPARLAVELGAVVTAVEVDRELAGALRQLVVEGDPRPPAGAAADRRTREAAAEGPEPGLRAWEDLLLGLADRDPDVILVEDPRDRQARPEGDGSERRLRRQRQQVAAPAPEGQERGQGTAAEGAEEGPAPEAVRS